MDQLVLERDKLLAKLSEISNSDENPSSKPINSQEDEGEEGEISESD